MGGNPALCAGVLVLLALSDLLALLASDLGVDKE
jgi:hypothetical protein